MQGVAAGPKSATNKDTLVSLVMHSLISCVYLLILHDMVINECLVFLLWFSCWESCCFQYSWNLDFHDEALKVLNFLSKCVWALERSNEGKVLGYQFQ